MRHVVQTQDTVRDTLGLDDADPADFGGVVAMGAAAGLGVYALDVNHSQRVAWNNTTLIEVETELLLSVCLVHEVLVNGVAVVDDSVGLILDGSLLILCDAPIVSDVEMCTLDGLLGTILPDVRSQHFSTRSEYDVSASVMRPQLLSALGVNANVHLPSFEGLPVGQLAVHYVQHHLAHLLGIHDLEGLLNTLNLDLSCIVLLTSGCRIDSALVENHDVSLAMIEDVSKNINNLSLKMDQVVILIVQIVSLRKVNCTIENGLRSLGDSLLSLSNFIVEVTWGRLLGDL